MKTLNVLYQSSSAYAIPAAVSILSLLENNKSIDVINIYYIDVGLTDEDRDKTREMIESYGRTVTFLNAAETDKMLEDAGMELWSGSYATFYKIFVCSGLDELDRILYIDADTVVQGSLEELCDYDMGGYAAAMVGSGMTGALKSFMKLPDYFNAGLIYYNLAYWREHKVKDAFLKAVKSPMAKKLTIVADETLNNYVMKGRIKKLPLKYNVESSWWLWGWNHKLYPYLGWNDPEDCYYTDEEIKDALDNPVIGHYVDLTTGRPWDKMNDNPRRKEFEKYLEMLHPWKEIDFAMRGIGGNNMLIVGCKWIVKKMMPFSLRSRVGFKQHDKAWKDKIREYIYSSRG